MNDADKLQAVIRFKRDVSFPRFSMKAGERWSFVVFGKMEQRLAAIKAGDRFEFAGGQCLAEDVEIVYEGPANLEHAIAAGYIKPAPTQQRVIQTTTGKEFPLVEATAIDWASELPTEEADGIFVSEGVGNINGSVFCYWIGNKDIKSQDVLAAIQSHINDHDIVGLRYIRELPSRVHPAIQSGARP